MTTGASVRAAGVFLGGDFAEGVVGRYGRRPPSFTVPQIPAIKYSMNAARTHTLREHGPPRLPSSLPSPPSKKRAEALLSPAPKPPTTHPPARSNDGHVPWWKTRGTRDLRRGTRRCHCRTFAFPPAHQGGAPAAANADVDHDGTFSRTS